MEHACSCARGGDGEAVGDGIGMEGGRGKGEGGRGKGEGGDGAWFWG